MDRRLVVAGGFLAGWPVLALLVAMLPGLGGVSGFFASGTVVLAWASAAVGLSLLAFGFLHGRPGPNFG